MKNLILLSFTLTLTNCFLQTKYEIHDLMTNEEVCFKRELAFWTTDVTDPKSVLSYNCAGNWIIGGQKLSPSIVQDGKVLQRSYKDLPEHKYIRFSFKFWAIDSWDKENDASKPYDSFDVQFDSLPIFKGFNMDASKFPAGSLCGKSTYRDFPDGRIYGWIEHSSTSLLLSFIDKLSGNSAGESLGMREVKLLFTESIPTGSSYCAYTGTTPIYHQAPCTCPTGQYSGGSGCTGCHGDCESCFGYGSDKCFACSKGRYFDGEGCKICDSSCSDCSGPGEEECTACGVGFVLWNGKCIPDTRCVNLMTIDGCTGDCVSPCLGQDINSWEEYCFPSCATGYISNLESTCIRCESLVVQYLKATDLGHQYSMKLSPGSCNLDIQMVRRYIKITENVEGSVGSFTYEITKTGSNQYFVNLVLADTVLESTTLDVKLSFLKGTMPVPKKFVPSPFLQEITEMIPTAKTVLTGSISGSILVTVLMGASASVWSIISFQQFVSYFIYMNIEFPYQTELFLMLLQSSIWDMLPNPLSSVMSSLSESILKEDAGAVTIYDPPAKFVKYEVSSFFVENGGTIIAVNLIFPVILWLVMGLRKTQWLKENFIMEKIEGVLRWNFIARSFLENGIPLSLAIFLQFRIMMFNNLYLSLCSSFAIFSFLLTVGSVLALWMVLKNRNNQQLKKSNIEEMFGTLYEGVVLIGGSTKYYHLVILLRGILIVCLVSFFESIPLFQIAPLILFNISLVYYMFKQVPYEDKKLTKIVRIKEIFILCAELCVFCLLFGSKSRFYYEFIGYLVLAFLATGLAIEVIYMFVLQIIALKNLPKSIKKSYRDMKEFWNKCVKNRKTPSIQAKHRLDTTVIRIRPNDTSGDSSSLNISSENQTIMKF